MPIITKTFLGLIQTKEIKLFLKQSSSWKKDKELGQPLLEETNWQDKEYIGFFLPEMYPYGQVKEKEEEIKIHLRQYCPKLILDHRVFYLFPQVFLT